MGIHYNNSEIFDQIIIEAKLSLSYTFSKMKKKKIEKRLQFEQEKFKDLKPIKKWGLIATIILFFIILSLIILFYEKKAFQLIGGMGFTQDDSWIHFTLARSINEGHWFSINPGEATAVSTAPL